MDDYKRGGHTKHSMKVHVILVTKYRKKIFSNIQYSDDVKQFVYEISQREKVNIIQIETDKDHIHMLLEYSPKQSVSSIVKIIKQYTTYKMWYYHKRHMNEQYWKKKILWSDGYFACSVGQVSQAILEKYIQEQG